MTGRSVTIGNKDGDLITNEERGGSLENNRYSLEEAKAMRVQSRKVRNESGF